MYKAHAFTDAEARRDAFRENTLDMLTTLIHTELPTDVHLTFELLQDTREHVQEWIDRYRDIEALTNAQIQAFVWESVQTLKGM
jgi:hypothetical protein